MRKISLLLGMVGGAALVSVAAVQGVAASPVPGPPTILKFDTMVPVTGPYVGPANPIRGVPGGGLPWRPCRSRCRARTRSRTSGPS